jgi:hypothetical protein
MALSRTHAVVLCLLPALLLTGCGDSNGEPDSAAGAPTRASTPDAAVSWAGGVCSASADLRASVREVGGALTVTSPDQLRVEVRDRVAAVRQSAGSLNAALSAIPAGSDPELVAAQQQLQTAAQQAQSSIDRLGAAAGQVTEIQTAAEAATVLPALRTALTDTSSALETYLVSLRTTVTGGTDALRASFGAAPACADMAAAPSSTP